MAGLTFLSTLPQVIHRNVKSKSHARIIWLVVSLWFRRSYDCVLQRDTNVGTGTLSQTVLIGGRRTPFRKSPASAVGPVAANLLIFLAGILPAQARLTKLVG